MYPPKHKPFKNDPDLKEFLLTVLLLCCFEDDFWRQRVFAWNKFAKCIWLKLKGSDSCKQFIPACIFGQSVRTMSVNELQRESLFVFLQAS